MMTPTHIDTKLTLSRRSVYQSVKVLKILNKLVLTKNIQKPTKRTKTKTCHFSHIIHGC